MLPRSRPSGTAIADRGTVGVAAADLVIGGAKRAPAARMDALGPGRLPSPAAQRPERWSPLSARTPGSDSEKPAPPAETNAELASTGVAGDTGQSRQGPEC